jgi:hypothetical protein
MGTNLTTPVTIGTGEGYGLSTGNLIDIIPTGKDLSLINSVTITSLATGVPSTVFVANDKAEMTYVASDSELTTTAYPSFDLKNTNVGLLKIVNDADPADTILLDDLAVFTTVELITNSSRT